MSAFQAGLCGKKFFSTWRYGVWTGKRWTQGSWRICRGQKPSFGASSRERRRSAVRTTPRRMPCRGVRKRELELFSRDVNRIFSAASESAARAASFALKNRWSRLFPSAVQVVEKDLDS
jgi:hypothetical protein